MGMMKRNSLACLVPAICISHDNPIFALGFYPKTLHPVSIGGNLLSDIGTSQERACIPRSLGPTCMSNC